MKPFICGVVGYKNSGKTTTCCELIKRFCKCGYRVGSIKSDAHQFEVDYPGKDTWLHREAGAEVVAISSSTKTAIMETRSTALEDLIARIQDVDVIVIEGYKSSPYPKICLLTEERHVSMLMDLQEVIAVVAPFSSDFAKIPVFQRNNYDQMFSLLMERMEERS